MSETRQERARRALAANPVFGALDPAQLKALTAYGTTARYAAGAVIFARGDPGHSLMVVLGGRVRVSNGVGGGRDAILGYLGAGDLLGEVALLDGKPRSADAAAAESCELFVLRRRELAPLLASQPALTMRLFEVLCERLRRTTGIIEELMGLSAGPRIAMALLRLAEEHGTRSGGAISIRLRFSQSELGGQVGLSREVVNRQLNAWQRAGVVAFDRAGITLRAPRRLEAIARGGASAAS